VGRTCILDGSIEQKNKRAEIHTCGKNRWVNRGNREKNRWVNRLNRGKNRCHCYTLLQFQQREEDETKDSERRKKKETIKNSSNLMLRIETAIKDSRFFCSSALLRD
jgi:ABC-type Fe3+/spermidine/putrescine transport system ATPase subunit